MDKALIVYWSGTGNTEAMANAIAAGMREVGGEADVCTVDGTSADALASYAKIAFGCPSMGAEELEESEFEPFFAAAEPSLGGKKVALFGSYGWGDGEWMRNWAQRTKATGANPLDEGLTQQEAPDETVCKEYGAKFAAF